MSNDTLDRLKEVVIKGKVKEAKPLAEQAITEGVDPKIIIFETLSGAMAVVGDKYENKQYFLPHVLLAANTMYQALDVVLPLMKVEDGAKSAGKVVLGVVEGDVHDIGKNIVKAMLTGAGLIIFDMGKDVPTKKFIEKCREEGAGVLATSTLMTPTLVAMGEIEKIMKQEGFKGTIKTIIGGGSTSKEFAAQIGADAWAKDAVEAVQTVEGLLN